MKRAALICALLLVGGVSGCSATDSATKTETPAAAPATTTTIRDELAPNDYDRID